ncbi:unknown protein [Waddlia chondrophila 2032/99]|uniref:Uncharacterized protein n=1 Tax=Waddlia chondrophila 2032/99 TaxID=765953 RepID=F8LA12_9BACT|nr:unknown protein [Waddlia chondrophila 2032/99]
MLPFSSLTLGIDRNLISPSMLPIRGARIKQPHIYNNVFPFHLEIAISK